MCVIENLIEQDLSYRTFDCIEIAFLFSLKCLFRFVTIYVNIFSIVDLVLSQIKLDWYYFSQSTKIIIISDS